ncbi:sulfite exporter TauE/SafE family protein [Streptomyces sp. CRN 30]|uniref:sulfite exporter TauE/SafE family protein n=1 Tax=Streptomyces sp. CRN 30 TaxID=3075613 RepID=UPI002A833278|nr:sulfite exporter TauE/SafE family protein [Streptomyces sp. CRN 30]
MTPLEMTAVLLSGVVGGALNTVVGSGTLVTFPVLLAVGLPPVTATVSNALGLVPGSVGGAIGYRRELRGRRRRVLRLGACVLPGGLVGAWLLLVLPGAAFDMIVPVLVGLALVLVAVQPRLNARMRERRGRTGRAARQDGGPALSAGLALASVYGGYFSASQGTVYLSLMGALLDDSLQRLNALKTVLVGMVNTVAAGFFLYAAEFDWTAVLLLAAGSAVGGRTGAGLGRRLPQAALRAVVLAWGTVALVLLLIR